MTEHEKGRCSGNGSGQGRGMGMGKGKGMGLGKGNGQGIGRGMGMGKGMGRGMGKGKAMGLGKGQGMGNSGCGCGSHDHDHDHSHGEGCGCGSHDHDHDHSHGEGCGCGGHDHDHHHSHHGQPYIDDKGTYVGSPQFFVKGNERIGVYALREGLNTLLPLAPEDDDAQAPVTSWDLFLAKNQAQNPVLGVVDYIKAIEILKLTNDIFEGDKVFIKAMSLEDLISLMEACSK